MDKDQIVKKIASEMNMNMRVVEQVVNSPFIFARRMISSDTDERAIRFPYFGVFAIKKGWYKNDKYTMIIRNIVKRFNKELKECTGTDKEAGLRYAYDLVIEELESSRLKHKVLDGIIREEKLNGTV